MKELSGRCLGQCARGGDTGLGLKDKQPFSRQGTSFLAETAAHGKARGHTEHGVFRKPKHLVSAGARRRMVGMRR